MSDLETQQIERLLSEARATLICLPPHPQLDEIAAGLALYKVLKSRPGSKVKIIADDFQSPKQLQYLEKLDQIDPKLPQLQNQMIKLKLKGQVPEIKHEVKDDELHIHLGSDEAGFKPEDLHLETSSYHFDLILTLGVVNFASLGKPFKQAPDFFYLTPLINIDNKAHNEHFGQFNIIEPSALSVSGILHSLIIKLQLDALINKSVATDLLTGLMAASQGFKAAPLSPRLLDRAGCLMEKGADIAAIHEQLYFTRSLPELQLWGRALARLREIKELNLIVSLLPYDDFLKTRAAAKNLKPVIDELLNTYHDAKLVLLLWQNHDQRVNGLLKAYPPHNALQLLETLNAQGRTDLVGFQLDTKNLLEAEETITNILRAKLVT